MKSFWKAFHSSRNSWKALHEGRGKDEAEDALREGCVETAGAAFLGRLSVRPSISPYLQPEQEVRPPRHAPQRTQGAFTVRFLPRINIMGKSCQKEIL